MFTIKETDPLSNEAAIINEERAGSRTENVTKNNYKSGPFSHVYMEKRGLKIKLD